MHRVIAKVSPRGKRLWSLAIIPPESPLVQCGFATHATWPVHSLTRLRQGDPIIADDRESETIANTELNLADVFFARGDFTLAHELLDGVSRLVRDPATSDWMKWRYSTHLFASLGELHLARGELHKAQESINQCLEIATRTHSQKYIVKGWRLQGQIALAQHDHDEACRWFQQALSLAQSVGNPTQLWQTHLALGRLHSAMRHGERDKQAYQAAQAVIDQARMKIRTPELRANLARSPLMQRVYDLSES
jgi:tetratricopeptide (TPR) repeat protein